MIKSKNISLVPYDQRYYGSTLDIINKAEVMLQINRVLPVSEIEHELWSRNIVQKSDSVIFAITINENSKHIGNCGLKNIDYRSRKAELWIYLDLENVNKGYGKDAVELLIKYGFNWLNLNRLYVYCLDYNIRAQNLFIKCGFHQEGVFKEDVYIRGEYRDTVRMAILKKNFLKKDELNVKQGC